jgi:hypothetical protein
VTVKSRDYSFNDNDEEEFEASNCRSFRDNSGGDNGDDSSDGTAFIISNGKTTGRMRQSRPELKVGKTRMTMDKELNSDSGKQHDGQRQTT